MKILVIQTAFPGDAILTLPMIQKLYEENKNSSIDVLAIPSTKGIFKHSKYVNEVIVFDKKGKDKSLFSFISLIKEIRQRNYNLVISPHRSARSALVAFGAGANHTVSFDKSSFSFLYKEICRYDKTAHEVKRNLSLINYDVSENNWKVLPEIEISREIEEKVINKLAGLNNNNRFIAIAPGSVWATKRYPFEYFVEIVKRLSIDNFKIVIIGGKEDEKIGKELEKTNPDNIKSLAGEFTIVESIALLKKCYLLISNDSAPTHMGMAANIPVLTIYCSTIPDFGFYPYNFSSKSISYNDLACKPCGIHGYQKCPEGHFKCGYDLSPSVIIAEVNKILTGDIH